MLIHRWDAAMDDDEWREFVRAQGFGHLIAPGRERPYPAVVPTQFVLTQSGDGRDVVLLHLAKPNPIWEALEENPRVVLSVAGDWAFIPSSWKAIGEEDPALGIPTTYYAAAQLCGTAEVVGDPDETAAILRQQLAVIQPDETVVDPLEHGARLRTIQGIRIEVAEVRAKFKYGGNVDVDHREFVADKLVARRRPGDLAAERHLRRRMEAEET
jgi:transcriptional regulator